MEKNKKFKIITFLTIFFIISLVLGIIGLVKSFHKPEPIQNEVQEGNTVEENIPTPKAHYKLLKLEEGLFQESNFKYDEELLTLSLNENKLDTNIKDIKVYKVDDMFLLMYLKNDKNYILLYDKDYKQIISNDLILTNYKDFYISNISINEGGIIVYTKNNNTECKTDKENEQQIEQIVYLYKYEGKNKFSSQISLDTTYKQCS